MNISNSEGNLSPKLFLVKYHPDNFLGKKSNFRSNENFLETKKLLCWKSPIAIQKNDKKRKWTKILRTNSVQSRVKQIIMSLAMNISDGEGNLSPKLFFVKFHPDNFVWKPFMEKAIDLGTSR